MEIIIIGFVAVLHYFLSVQTEYWVIISVLGFRTYLPLGYMKSPAMYHWTNRILGIALILLGLLDGANLGYTLLIWFVIFFASGKKGRGKAFSAYRETMIELMEWSDDEEERQDFETKSKYSDEEIEQLVDQRMKWGL